MRNRYVGYAADDHGPGSFIVFLQTRGHIFFHAGHIEWRQELSVRQLRQPFLRSADARESFHIVIPGLDILIPDGPVDANAFFDIALEIEVAPAVALPPP